MWVLIFLLQSFLPCGTAFTILIYICPIQLGYWRGAVAWIHLLPTCRESEFESWALCWVGQDHLHICWFAGRTHRMQHTIILTTTICYSERLRCKSALGKAHGANSRGNQVWTSKSLLPVESLKAPLRPGALNCDGHCEALSPGEAH